MLREWQACGAASAVFALPPGTTATFRLLPAGASSAFLSGMFAEEGKTLPSLTKRFRVWDAGQLNATPRIYLTLSSLHPGQEGDLTASRKAVLVSTLFIYSASVY